MGKNKIKQHEIYKIETGKIISANKDITNLKKDTAKFQGEVVKVMDNLVLKKIRDYYKEINTEDRKKTLHDIAEDLVNIITPSDKSGVGEYDSISDGFKINSNTYCRFASGSGQIRRNTVSFIRNELYEKVFNALLCGLELDDFGDDFNAAKFNAYFGLNMSGSYLLKEFPNVCIVDDYEIIKPDIEVNFIQTEEINYIALPDGDLILDNNQKEYKLDGKHAIKFSDIEKLGDKAPKCKIYKGYKKYPIVKKYSEINSAPCLNSFDGQGLCDPDYMKKVAVELGFCKLDTEGNIKNGYLPSQMIIRAPWVKGLVATFPIRDYFGQKGIEEIIDSFGHPRKVKEIDMFISKSQFKMHKIYKKKCENIKNETGKKINPWDYHQKAMLDNGLLWGVVMPNKETDDDFKTLNYQYNSALILSEEDIEELCKETFEFLTNLCSGDLQTVLETLIHIDYDNKEVGCSDEDLDTEIETEENDDKYKSFYQKAIEHNYSLLDDKYIQELIYNDCKAKFKQAKISKLLVQGNFQFIVSDPVAQVEWILKNHTTEENKEKIEVKGVIPAYNIYSNYWRAKTTDKQLEEIVLMRSPLIDRHEVTKMNLLLEEIQEFRYLKSGIILSIHDLATLQMQNCDFDGDRCFSSNMEVLKRGCLDKTYPLYYESSSESITGKINNESMIEADKRGINSKVGKFSNYAASFYAMLPNYKNDSLEYKSILNSLNVLGEVVGVEIDKIKTGIAPEQPYNWKAIQNNYASKHNKLIPDIKPYFFRHLYPYLDRDIRDLKTEFNKACKPNYGMTIDKLTDMYYTDSFSDEVKGIFKKRKSGEKITDEECNKIEIYYTIQNYKKIYPVIDSDCIANNICHKFETLEEQLTKFHSGRNMLKDFITEEKFEQDKIDIVTKIIKLYKKQNSFIHKYNNTEIASSSKNIAVNTKSRIDNIKDVTRNNIYTNFTSEGTVNYQSIFNYMVKILGDNDAKYVWDVMNDDIFNVIPQKEYKELEEIAC